MIRAYPKESSVEAGQSLVLCASSDVPSFTVTFYRQQSTLRRSLIPDARCEARRASPNEAWRDFEWPEYSFEIPADAEAGVYVAVFSETAIAPPNEIATESYFPSHAALFVVLPPALAIGERSLRPLYRIPLFTYHAYHVADIAMGVQDATLYTGASSVSLRRPGGGAGAVPWDHFNIDVYDSRTPRQTFAHWDAKFIAWAATRDIQFDYCTDLDLHRRGRELLDHYRLAISSGHDEYWSREMYEAQASYLKDGGNLSYFGANTAWARVEIDAALTMHRAGQFDHEEKLIGVTFAQAGGRWAGARPRAGYRVHNASHWAFTDTNLVDGETFGADLRLVGYECDGISSHSPIEFDVLASCDISDWQDPDPAVGEQYGAMRASLGVYTTGGTLFNAGTADWPRLLALDAVVDRVTANVIAKLSRPAPARSGLIRTREGAGNVMAGDRDIDDARGHIDEIQIESTDGERRAASTPVRLTCDDVLHVRGWGLAPSGDGGFAVPLTVFAVIDDAVRIGALGGSPRDDIAALTGDPSLRHCEFRLRVTAKTLLAILGAGRFAVGIDVGFEPDRVVRLRDQTFTIDLEEFVR